MSTIKFAVPLKAEVIDSQTGIKGCVISAMQLINGCVKYAVQPRSKDGCAIPEAHDIDEENLIHSVPVNSGWEYTFEFETGDQVKNLLTGCKGFIRWRIVDANMCERYIVEGPPNKQGELIKFLAMKQELILVDKGLNKVKPKVSETRSTLGVREKTGCVTTKSTKIGR